jgi:hypothetical protein
MIIFVTVKLIFLTVKFLNMNDRQNTKLNMAQRVSDTLSKYYPVYAHIAPVRVAAAELMEKISSIRKMNTTRGSVHVPAATVTKQAAENAMVDDAMRFTNSLYVIGFSSGNAELTGLSSLNPSSFFKAEDNESLSLARRIESLAKTYATVLANYGLDNAAIDAFRARVDAFAALIAAPMGATGERKQKTTALYSLFADLDSVLYDKLDKLMVLFKASHPDFYGEYRTSRNLINLSARHRTGTAKSEDTK